jgi:hypothetical protein
MIRAADKNPAVHENSIPIAFLANCERWLLPKILRGEEQHLFFQENTGYLTKK